MTHKFIVCTRNGAVNSLKDKVQILFTLTPVESKRSTCSYNPVAFKAMTFAGNSNAELELNWESKLAFDTYEAIPKGGRKVCKLPVAGSPSVIPAGKSVTMTSSNNRVNWSYPSKNVNEFGQSAVLVENRTGSLQNVALLVRAPELAKYRAIAAYEVESWEDVIAPSKLVVQAYIVDPSITYTDSVLRPEDLTRPLFAVPLDCESLPASSTWKLTQDPNGELQLTPDSQVELGGHSIETLAKSLSDMRGQMSTMLKYFEGAQRRLAAVEKSLEDSQIELSTTKNQLTEAHLELSRLGRKPPELDRSIIQAGNRIERAEISTSRTETEVTSGQKTSFFTRTISTSGFPGSPLHHTSYTSNSAHDFTQTQLKSSSSHANLKVPMDDAKSTTFEASPASINVRLELVEKSLADAKQGAQQSEAKVWDKLKALEESAGRTTGDFSATREPVATLSTQLTAIKASVERNSRDLAEVKASSKVVQRDSGLPAVHRDLESRLVKVEESTGSIQDRVGTVERSIRQTRQDLGTVQQLTVAAHSQISRVNKLAEDLAVVKLRTRPDPGRV